MYCRTEFRRSKPSRIPFRPRAPGPIYGTRAYTCPVMEFDLPADRERRIPDPDLFKVRVAATGPDDDGNVESDGIAGERLRERMDGNAQLLDLNVGEREGRTTKREEKA